MKLKYLQTNGKLKASSIYTYAFNLPAGKTCPWAGGCRKDGFCFALSEEKRYPSARAYRQRSFELSRSAEFTATINAELELLRKFHGRAGTRFAVRIHASGDFYSKRYVRDWFNIALMNPDIQFYAYTKSVVLFKQLPAVPSNLVIIYSIGSTADALVDRNIDRHAQIFESEEQAIAAGYTLASEDDTIAWSSTSNKIGLVAFGAVNKFRQSVARAQDGEQTNKGA